MKNVRLVFLIAFISGIACIVSGIIAANLPGSESDGSSNMSDVGTTIKITLLVTVPAFLICITTLAAGIIALLLRRKK